MANDRTPRPDVPRAPVTLARELDDVLAVRGREREDLLLESDRLPALVAGLPPEELFFTLKEADPDNVPALLGAARPAQVQFLFDLELWHKDRLRTEKAAPWLRRLAECGPGPLARWAAGLDVATWVLLLGSLVKVKARDEESDPFQDESGRAPVTIDGVYYLWAPEGMETVVRDVLQALRESGAERYQQFVEALLQEIDSEFEEQMHEEKERRLGERGFPSWEEAYHIYARLTEDGLRAAPGRSGAPAGAAGGEREAPPHYPIAAKGVAPDLLARALGRVGGGALEQALRYELACLTNKVVVADGLDVEQLGSFHRALVKVAGYVSIGLEALGGPDEEAAASALRERWLEHLFRVGWTHVREAQHRARRFVDKGWPQGRMERLLFLDSPLPEALDALLRRHPLCYQGESETPSARDFRTLSEVQRASGLVEKADFLGRFLLSVIDFRLADVREASSRLDVENLKGTTVFLTALLNAALERPFRFAPVERTDARRGLSKIWRDDRPPRRARPELGDSAVEWARSVAPVGAGEEVHLRQFVAESLALLEEEFGHLAADEVPDPRFTRGLWIT